MPGLAGSLVAPTANGTVGVVWWPLNDNDRYEPTLNALYCSVTVTVSGCRCCRTLSSDVVARFVCGGLAAARAPEPRPFFFFSADLTISKPRVAETRTKENVEPAEY